MIGSAAPARDLAQLLYFVQYEYFRPSGRSVVIDDRNSQFFVAAQKRVEFSKV
jgi:hypothetical protein